MNESLYITRINSINMYAKLIIALCAIGVAHGSGLLAAAPVAYSSHAVAPAVSSVSYSTHTAHSAPAVAVHAAPAVAVHAAPAVAVSRAIAPAATSYSSYSSHTAHAAPVAAYAAAPAVAVHAAPACPKYTVYKYPR
nr:cuticle protein 16.5-like [Danaus plexippus plexippus]